MKNLKKLVSVIVTVAMLISSFAVLTVGAATGEYGDVEATNSYYKAIKVLSGLGIVKGDDEGNFNPTNDIKRSEMVALVCRALGEEAVALSSAGASFDDVSADHWAAGYIAWGVAGGIVNGVGDNKFDPDASVKFQDAVVMVMRALGYERIANRDANGGYPTGYLKVASQQGVLAGANYAGEKAATREVVAQVIYNAMTTPIVEVSFYAADPDDDEYAVYNGKNDTDLRTLLTWTNEVYKVKATVDKTAKTDPATLGKDVANPKAELTITGTYDYAWKEVLDGTVPVSDNNGDGIFDIDGFQVYAGETNVADYVGYTVEAYIAEDANGAWELLAVVVDTKATDEETVATDNYVAYTTTGTGSNVVGTYEYYENIDDQKTTKITVDDDALIIYYNGAALATAEYDTLGERQALLAAANSITFMGPKNADYNKIFITDYTYKQVESVKAANDFVKFTSGSLTLDPEERGNETFVYNLYDEEGNVITLADVKEDDIFNIVAPTNGSGVVDLYTAPYMDIYVTSKSVTGVISEDKDTNNDTIADTFVIDGIDYKAIASVAVQDEGIFFLTIDDQIFAADASSSTARDFAFLVAQDSETKFSTTVYQIRMWTEDGTVANYTVAPTVKVTVGAASPVNYRRTGTAPLQSVLFSSGGAVYDAVATSMAASADADETAAVNVTAKTAAEANLKNRLVTYRLNAAGEIAELTFAGASASSNIVTASVSGKYNDDINTFAGRDLDDNSKLFLAPVSKVGEGTGVDAGKLIFGVDEEDIELLAFSSMDPDAASNTAADVFTFKNDDYLGAALIKAPLDLGIVKTHLAVVRGEGTSSDADGMTVKSYSLFQSGEVVSLKADYDVFGSSSIADENTVAVGNGDVIQYTTNVDGEINEVNIVYDADAISGKLDEGSYTMGSLDTNKVAFVAGIVTEVKNGAMSIDTTVGDGTGTIQRARLNETEGNTYALVNKDAITRPNDVEKLAGADMIRESYSNVYYLAIAIVNEDGRFEDVVQVKLDGIAGLAGDPAVIELADVTAFLATL